MKTDTCCLKGWLLAIQNQNVQMEPLQQLAPRVSASLSKAPFWDIL